jgi:hypothetical protein
VRIGILSYDLQDLLSMAKVMVVFLFDLASPFVSSLSIALPLARKVSDKEKYASFPNIG